MSDVTGDDERAPGGSDLFGNGPLVLDGGLGTLLESRGHDLSSNLWSARLLRDDPHAILDAHREFYRAGARIAITASYQVSYDGLALAGIDEASTTRLLELSVELARAARDECAADGVRRFVAASVSPYGATLGDGSEYHGDYGLSVDELREWHRRRLAVLAAAGADIIAVETIPSLTEIEAIADELDDLRATSWLSVTAAHGALRSGESLFEAFRLLDGVESVVAVGVNCTDPRDVSAVIATAREATAKPFVAYPNSGETWDARERRWVGDSRFSDELVSEWLATGATIVGGCCRIGPVEIAAMARVV